MKFLENVDYFYAMYDKAVEENDQKMLKHLSQFTNKKLDGKKFTRRQICENMAYNAVWTEAGYEGIPLNDCGWHAPHFPMQEQKITKLGVIVNRGCCNIEEKQLITILNLPNGKWVAAVEQDFSDINKTDVFLSIWSEQYDTRTEAWNNALTTFINRWKRNNKDVKKDDEAIRNAKGLLIVDKNFFEYTPMPKGEAVQLTLF